MKNKGFMTSVQLHIPSSVEFSLFLLMSANSGFQVGETGCQGREQVSLLPRSMWESNPLLMFRSLSCSLLSSVTVKSFFSFQKAKKKKKVLTNSSWGSRVSIFCWSKKKRQKSAASGSTTPPPERCLSHSLPPREWGNRQGRWSQSQEPT